MQLDEFITSALTSLVTGVKNAQQFAKENNAVVNPEIGDWDKNKVLTTYYGNKNGIKLISTVEFDIAVTVGNQQEAGAKAGINVLSLNFGGNVLDRDIKETISRIKFNVNIVLPPEKTF